MKRSDHAGKKILVVVSGEGKADIVSRAFFGPVTPEVPASILQMHPDVTVVCDEAALSCHHYRGKVRRKWGFG